MTNPVALFINGIFQTVLDEILPIQTIFPYHIMFLQPYSASPMVQLRDDPPTASNPMTLYLSLTSDLSTVRYQAQIVGWEDKRTMPPNRREVIEYLIQRLQPKEAEDTGQGLYNASESGESTNLLHIRRLHLLSDPFSVSRLRKISDQQPLSTNRTQAGGWSYVTLD